MADPPSRVTTYRRKCRELRYVVDELSRAAATMAMLVIHDPIADIGASFNSSLRKKLQLPDRASGRRRE
jgi:hypothetical protein